MRTIQQYKDKFNFAMEGRERHPIFSLEFQEEANKLIFEGAKEYGMLPREFKSRLMFTF